MEKIYNHFVNHLTEGHFEGMMLYVFGTISITTIHFINMKEWRIGLRGPNNHWESPEICIYIFTWIFPHSIMADQFLGLKASDWVWYFQIALLAFGLTGRFGLEWLLAFKNGGTTVSSTTIELTKKETKTDENKPS